MKFIVRSAWDYFAKTIDEFQSNLKIKVDINKYKLKEENDCITMEINSLEELLMFMKDCNEDIVISNDDGIYEILIYNDYIE